MDHALLTLLRQVDTPTVCNAIEVAQGRRGFDRFTRHTMLCSAPGEVMVGYAVTARIAAKDPSAEPPATLRERRLTYLRTVWDAPKPCVVVIEDVDAEPVGAFWGEVNTMLHRALGAAGALTNGVMRDLGDLATGFPVVAGHVGPSHGFVHLREVGGPVTVCGLEVRPLDLIHADRHSAVVVPAGITASLAGAIRRLQASEEVILRPSRAGFGSFNEVAAAWAAFERART